MRFNPQPLRARMAREGETIVDLARRTGYHVDSLGAILRSTPDPNGRRGDGLTWWQADRLAVALGCHPVELWGAQWFDFYKQNNALAVVGIQRADGSERSHADGEIAA